MTWRTSKLAVTMLIILGSALILPAISAAQTGAAATLSVLAPPVDRVAAGAAGRTAGVDGMNLTEGDLIKTGAGGVALITFLDGSTVTVLPDAEVTVKQIGSGSERRNSGIRMLIHAGRVWARVVQAAGRRPSPLSLESNEYTATAHDGLIGAERSGNGFVCWSRRGELRLTDRSGQTDVVVMPGRRARAIFGSPVVPEPFVPSASVLEVRTSGPVLPLLRMPDGRIAAGFAEGGAEVNQVFGSLTERQGADRWLVEVPAGYEGPFTLVLTGVGTGSFVAKISARYGGLAVYRQEVKGDVHQGERLFTRITHELSGRDPQTARVTDASFEALRKWNGEPAIVTAVPGPARDGLN
jgi:FecR protein